MPRTIVAPPDFTGAPLAQLKEWLAITTAREDALLTRLIAAAHDACETFTGLMPLGCGVEERLALAPGWTGLTTRPVRAFAGVSHTDADGEVAALPITAWSQAIAADGGAQLRLTDPPGDGFVTVGFTAGLAESWDSLPAALAEGIIRLAAHAYRSRDSERAGDPPAAVAALWRPWRRVRL